VAAGQAAGPTLQVDAGRALAPSTRPGLERESRSGVIPEHWPRLGHGVREKTHNASGRAFEHLFTG
jgi:hypothetical protein